MKLHSKWLMGMLIALLAGALIINLFVMIGGHRHTEEEPAIYPLYFVVASNEGLNIYTAQTRQQIGRVDACLSLLPATDRAYLERGIPVYSASELRNLLDAYTS